MGLIFDIVVFVPFEIVRGSTEPTADYPVNKLFCTLSCCVHYSGGWGRGYRIHIIFNNYMYLQNSSVWARLTDERVARDIMRFGFGVYLTNHSREARFEGPKL